MKAQIRYTVHCSHEAFTKAMEQHMPGAKFYEIPWRDTDRIDEDSDTYSSFSWPNKHHPELTKDLFFLMLCSVMLHDGKRAEFYVEVNVKTEEGVQALSVSDAWLPDYGEARAPELHYRQDSFNKDMAERMAKIAALATDGSDI